MSDGTTATIMSAAFPRDLRHDVMAVNEIVPVPRRDTVGSFAVVSAGEPLVILYRVYDDEPVAGRWIALTELTGSR